MEGSWWRTRNELDDEQQAVIRLPPDGRYLILGPPGCGKTNLLVLRAAYLARSKFRDLAVITFTNSLVNFIRSGAPQPLQPAQVSTHIGWLRSTVFPRLTADEVREIKAIDDIEQQRARLAEEFIRLSTNEDVGNAHQAIFVDEVQDLLAAELRAVVLASDRITVAGDSRQSVYAGTALTVVDELGFCQVKLSRHYRIGHAIARIADRLIEPESAATSLLATSNYDEGRQRSSAELMELPDRDAQFREMTAKIRTQLKAFPKDLIGVLVPKRDALSELRQRFADSEWHDLVAFHGVDDGASFAGPHRIHVMTIKASKGTEFRAVHLYACEDAQYPQVSRRFWYTAVTRARTSLTAYASPGPKPLNARLLAAFATEVVVDLDTLFPAAP